MLQRLTNLCASRTPKGQVIKPRKHEQRLLRNMGAHQIVLELLQIPYEKVLILSRLMMHLAINKVKSGNLLIIVQSFRSILYSVLQSGYLITVIIMQQTMLKLLDAI